MNNGTMLAQAYAKRHSAKSLYQEIDDPSAPDGVRYKKIHPDQRINLKGGERFVTAQQAIAGPQDFARWKIERQQRGLVVQQEGEYATTRDPALLQQWNDRRAAAGLPPHPQSPGLSPIPPNAKAPNTAAMGDALEEIMKWGESIDNFVLQKNECSRLHTMVETLSRGTSIQITLDEGAKDDTFKGMFEHVQTFVVKHDWLAAFGDSLGEVAEDEYILPFPSTAFEFKINGRVCILLMLDLMDGVLEKAQELQEKMFGDRVGLTSRRNQYLFIAASNGVWAAYDPGAEPSGGLMQYLVKQAQAICVMLDSEVAESTVVRQPAALNAKRIKQGRQPLKDYHVVDLSRRRRAAPNPSPTPTGVRHRAHFVRGHWRHYPSHRTWIKWHLRGDPDLGFVEKEYKL